MDFWIPLIGSALGGAIVTSVFGLIKNRQDRHHEHDQWLRDQKLEVYANLLAALQSVLHDLSEMHDGGVPPTSVSEGAKTAREVDSHMSRFRLIAPEPLMQPAQQARAKIFRLIHDVNKDSFDSAGDAAAEALAHFHETATNDLHSKKLRHI